MKMLVWKTVTLNNKGEIGKGIDYSYNFERNVTHTLDLSFRSIRLCNYGFHFGTSLSNLLRKWFVPNTNSGRRIALCEVEINEALQSDETKACSNNIKILKVLSLKNSLALKEMFDKSKKRDTNLELKLLKFAFNSIYTK